MFAKKGVRPAETTFDAVLTDVADIEHGQQQIVVVSNEFQILLQSGETCIADIRSVDKGKQIL